MQPLSESSIRLFVALFAGSSLLLLGIPLALVEPLSGTTLEGSYGSAVQVAPGPSLVFAAGSTRPADLKWPARAEAGEAAAQTGFVKNVGQKSNADVMYYLERPGIAVGFGVSSFTVVLGAPSSPDSRPTESASLGESHAIRVTFEGAVPVVPQAFEPQPRTLTYFQGSTPSASGTSAPVLGHLEYPSLYAGVKFQATTAPSGAKYEIIIDPGSRVSDFVLRFEGHDTLSLDSDGNLVVQAGNATLIDEAPVAWSGDDLVECEYRVLDRDRVSNACRGWSGREALVIDPLVYSTFLGGSADDQAWGVAVDANGSAIVLGQSRSTNFPTTPGAYDTSQTSGFDIFLTKLAPDGSSAIWSTFVGGGTPQAIALDSSGSSYVTGYTTSSAFPTTPGAPFPTFCGGSSCAFAFKLSADGDALSYSTFLGGSNRSYGHGIAVANDGSAFIVGYTNSTDFPTTAGAFSTVSNANYETFVSKLAPDGASLQWSTFLGGSQWDEGRAIAVDGNGSAFVTGVTLSSDFPTTPSAFDRGYSGQADFFIAKFNDDGSALTYSTFLGGSGLGDGEVSAIAIDGNGSAAVGGWTMTEDFPVTNDAFDRTCGNCFSLQQEGFVTKLTPSGDGLVFSSYLGGGDDDEVIALAFDSGANILATGRTVSPDYPVAGAGLDTSRNGSTYDAFLTRFSPDGSTSDYSGYIGGSTQDEGRAIAVDAAGAAFIAGFTAAADSTTPSGFPTTAGAFQPTGRGEADAFALKFSLRNPSIVSISATEPGVVVSVNGVNFATPFNFTCDAGARTLQVPSPQGDEGTRLLFDRWADGALEPRTVTCGPNDITLSVVVHREYRVRLQTDPSGLELGINGLPASSSLDFWAMAGASLALTVDSPQQRGDARFSFARWSDDGVINRSIPITAPVDLTAHFDSEYLVHVTSLVPGALARVNGESQPLPHSFWAQAGAIVTLDVPSPQASGDVRLTFAGWTDGGAEARILQVLAPTALTAEFTREFRWVISTSPVALAWSLDGTTMEGEQNVWLAEGSSHTLSTPNPQSSGAVSYAFQYWTDGGGRTHTFNAIAPQSLQAIFATVEATVVVQSSPAGLSLTIDGQTWTAPAILTWALGSVHALSAPSPQGVGNTRYDFSGWSPGGNQNLTFTVTGDALLTAIFVEEYAIRLRATPDDVEITVDGASVPTPATFWWPAGSLHEISATTVIGNGDSRLMFETWGGSRPRAFGLNVTGPEEFVAQYGLYLHVRIVTSPAGLAYLVDGAPFQDAADFWWAVGSEHAVEAPLHQTHNGNSYRFASWSDQGNRSHTTSLNAPGQLEARFELEGEPASTLFHVPLVLWVLIAIVVTSAGLLGLLYWRRRKREPDQPEADDSNVVSALER